MNDQDKQLLLDTIANIEGASYALGREAMNHKRGETPAEAEIPAWKNHGRQDGFRGHSLAAWLLANEIRKYKKKARWIIRRQ